MNAEDIGVSARILRHSFQLKATRAQRKRIAGAQSILVCCMRNERIRMPAFLAYYRRLGVEHFLIVDNESTDGLADFIAEQPDCSIWRAAGSYRAANFGMDWCNHLLARHGVGKWCITVDPDEFLVFPHAEQRGLRGLIRYMEGIGQPSLLAPLIDAYGPKRLSETHLTETSDPFELCPYFDRFNLTQQFNELAKNFWIQGGARMRRFFASDPQSAPALNKVPLVRWAPGYRYVSSMHHLNVPALNCTVRDHPMAVSGALFHFKYVNLLSAKASEELSRGQHYAGSSEYKAYLDAGDVALFDPEISLRYRDARQLEELGFMQSGGWF